MSASRMRVGLTERLFGPVVRELADPPAIPGWRLVDIETVHLADGDDLMVVGTARVRRGWAGVLKFVPTADAYYVREPGWVAPLAPEWPVPRCTCDTCRGV